MPLQKKIAILGGGQLGQMFIQNAISYGVDIAVLDPSENCSCAGLATSYTKGSFKDYDTVLAFGRQADIITIEIEHVNTDALFQLEKEGKTVIPSVRAIEIIKDKGLQKEFYATHNIPSSDFVLVENAEEIEKHQDKFPFFQKARKEGYDGKGVVKLKDETSLKNAFDCPSVLESLVDIEKELSVIVVRSQSGEMQVFPVVELVFDPVYNLVDYLKIPAEIDDSQLQEANDLAMKVVDALDSAGVFAVELFLTKEGKILVNETAPRAHNSGHHTIEASISSQFDQQLRVLLDLPIGSTKSYKAAAMINVVGSEGYTGKAKYEGVDEILSLDNVYLHLYGKEETRPGRKMGHATVIGFSAEEIKPKIEAVKEKLKVIS
ncbi:MAG: 5-(carboxyamino)imidazole ribonucleotide synthase [Chitinophagales bacterium]